MTRRYYSNNASARTLAGTINSVVVTVNLDAAPTGWPGTTPYFVELDKGTGSAEIVLVTGVSGTSLTVTRAQQGTSAASHAVGASAEHCFTALDADEANAHVSATTGVHGITGGLVGTTDAQTLTNKTLTTPVINTGSLATPTLTTPILAGTLPATPVTGQVYMSAFGPLWWDGTSWRGFGQLIAHSDAVTAAATALSVATTQSYVLDNGEVFGSSQQVVITVPTGGLKLRVVASVTCAPHAAAGNISMGTWSVAGATATQSGAVQLGSLSFDVDLAASSTRLQNMPVDSVSVVTAGQRTLFLTALRTLGSASDSATLDYIYVYAV